MQTSTHDPFLEQLVQPWPQTRLETLIEQYLNSPDDEFRDFLWEIIERLSVEEEAKRAFVQEQYQSFLRRTCPNQNA